MLIVALRTSIVVRLRSVGLKKWHVFRYLVDISRLVIERGASSAKKKKKKKIYCRNEAPQLILSQSSLAERKAWWMFCPNEVFRLPRSIRPVNRGEDGFSPKICSLIRKCQIANIRGFTVKSFWLVCAGISTVSNMRFCKLSLVVCGGKKKTPMAFNSFSQYNILSTIQLYLTWQHIWHFRSDCFWTSTEPQFVLKFNVRWIESGFKDQFFSFSNIQARRDNGWQSYEICFWGLNPHNIWVVCHKVGICRATSHFLFVFE